LYSELISNLSWKIRTISFKRNWKETTHECTELDKDIWNAPQEMLLSGIHLSKDSPQEVSVHFRLLDSKKPNNKFKTNLFCILSR
jgi:hypothetical protein